MQDVLNMNTAHLHSEQQAPLGGKGYSTSEAVMVQVLKKELYDVRDIRSPSEVERRKGNEKTEETELWCNVFYEVEASHVKKVDSAPTAWGGARALRGSEKLLINTIAPFLLIPLLLIPTVFRIVKFFKLVVFLLL